MNYYQAEYNFIYAFLDLRGIDYPECGFECPPGWLPIVLRALDRMRSVGWTGQLAQVKEKFGGLRIYVDDHTDEVDAVIKAAEGECWVTCTECGKRGTQIDDGWIRTLCEGCR